VYATPTSVTDTYVISEPLGMTVVSWRAQSGAERERMVGFRGVGIQGLTSWSESQEAKPPGAESFVAGPPTDRENSPFSVL